MSSRLDADFKGRHFPYVCHACGNCIPFDPSTNPVNTICDGCGGHYCALCYPEHMALGHSDIGRALDLFDFPGEP